MPGEEQAGGEGQSIRQRTADMGDFDKRRHLASLVGTPDDENAEIGENFVVDEFSARKQAYGEKRTIERAAARGDGWFSDRAQDLKDWIEDNPHKTRFVKMLGASAGFDVGVAAVGSAFGHPEAGIFPLCMQVAGLINQASIQDPFSYGHRTELQKLGDRDSSHRYQRDFEK